MDAITYTNLRQNLKYYMDKVFNDHDPLIIIRKNNENVVLMSVDEYNSLMETNYLLSNKANAEHLQKSINQHKSGKMKERNYTKMNKLFTDEPWADYQYWIDVDKKQLKRINLLIKDIDRNPHSGRQTVAYSRDVMRHFSKNSFGS